MQGGRDPFFGFGDPFGSFGGIGGQRSLISSFFGGKDPFDDPFFANPFGSMFGSSFFGSTGRPFMNPNATGFLEHQPRQSNLSSGPVIEELNSDDEEDEKKSGKEKQGNPRKHGRSGKEPIVEDPEDEVTEKRSKHMSLRNDINQMQYARSRPQSHSFTFQSSTVSYGGANGAYHTSSTTRRSGSDGLTFEECKEANSATGRATHRVLRGMHNKGHSVTRKLKSDGHVDTMQTLHNLNEDELVDFNEAWKGNARRHLPGLSAKFSIKDVTGSRGGNNSGGWALPAAEISKDQGGFKPEVAGMTGPPQQLGRLKMDFSDGTASSRLTSKGSGYGNQASGR